MKKECTAFQYMQELANQSLRQPQGAKTNELPKQDWLGLTFVIGSMLYATKMTNVEAVIPVGQIYSLPVQHSGVLGFSQYHNRVFAVVDLKAVFWKQESEFRAESRIIIYQYHDLWIGILVCACLGLKNFKTNQTEHNTPDESNSYINFITQMVYEDETHWAVLDAENLLSEINSGRLFLQQT